MSPSLRTSFKAVVVGVRVWNIRQGRDDNGMVDLIALLYLRVERALPIVLQVLMPAKGSADHGKAVKNIIKTFQRDMVVGCCKRRENAGCVWKSNDGNLCFDVWVRVVIIHSRTFSCQSSDPQSGSRV